MSVFVAQATHQEQRNHTFANCTFRGAGQSREIGQVEYSQSTLDDCRASPIDILISCGSSVVLQKYVGTHMALKSLCS